MKFETKAIWVGQAADKATGATIVPNLSDLNFYPGRSHGLFFSSGLAVRMRQHEQNAFGIEHIDDLLSDLQNSLN